MLGTPSHAHSASQPASAALPHRLTPAPALLAAGLTLLAGAAADLDKGGLEPLVDIESDEFRRLSSTNEFVAAPHIYAMDANNGAEQIAPFYHGSGNSMALSMVFHSSLPSMAVVVTSGCKDPKAVNYNPDENILADASCIYEARCLTRPPLAHTQPCAAESHPRRRRRPTHHTPLRLTPAVLRVHGSFGVKLQPDGHHQ